MGPERIRGVACEMGMSIGDRGICCSEEADARCRMGGEGPIDSRNRILRRHESKAIHQKGVMGFSRRQERRG